MIRRNPAPTRAQPALPPPADVRAMEAAATALFAGALVLFAVLALGWLAQRPQFALRGITVAGDVGRANVSTIRANAAPRLEGNFFTIDLALARQAFEALPWVRRAIVQRVWPDRLAVTLEEHRAAAWWHTDEGDDKLVNLQGEVFEANPGDVEDEDLPVLQGPEGSAATLLSMQRRLVPVFASIDERIQSLVLSARGSWRAVLDGGATVELGRGSEAEVLARTQAFAGTLTQLTARYQRPLESADLRHTGGYALRLQGIGTLEPGTRPAPRR